MVLRFQSNQTSRRRITKPWFCGAYKENGIEYFERIQKDKISS